MQSSALLSSISEFLNRTNEKFGVGVRRCETRRADEKPLKAPKLSITPERSIDLPNHNCAPRTVKF